ncbi:T9SS type A sorting domain-containing protein [Mucilaginibacter sp. HD30]
MVKKILFKLFAAALFLGCMFCFSGAVGQTITCTSDFDFTTSSTLRNGLTSQVLYGVNMTVSSNLTLGTLQFSSSNNKANSYFDSGILKMSTSGSYATATNVSGATVVINGDDITITGFSQAMSTGTTYTFYLVADCVFQSYATLPSTTQFSMSFVKGPGYFPSYSLSGAALGTTYSLAKPIVSVTNLTGGLTTGTLVNGQTGIVVFGFSVTVTGALQVDQFAITSANNAQAIFTNAKLYRSTTSTSFPTGFGSSIADGVINSTNTRFSCTENFPGAATTVNYFVTMDYTELCPASSTIQFAIGTAQSPAFIIAPGSVNYQSGNGITGSSFNIAKTINWIGGQAGGLWNDMANFATLCGPAPTSISNFDVVQVGVVTFTNQPVFTANTTLSQIIFGKTKAASLTTGLFTLNSGISTTNVGAAGNPTITGTGVITIPAGAISSIAASTTLTSSAPITNSTTMNIASGGSLILTGATTALINSATTGIIDNAGTLTVPNTGTSTNAGTVNITGTGGATYAGALTNSGTMTNSGSGSVVVTGAFSNSGTVTASLGTLDFNGATFTNTGTITQSGGTIDIVAATISNTNPGTFTASAGTVNLSLGGAQAIDNTNSTTPVTFNNLIVSTSGTKTLGGPGTFNVRSSGVVTLTGTAILAAAGRLTLKSAATGTASVAQIPSGASVTGNVTVERYFSGGALSNRGWRLMSFPVNTSGNAIPPTSSTVSSFTSLKTNLIITGLGGSASGWDQPSGYTANGPTILLYSNTGNGSFTVPTTFASTTSKAGQGFYFYFRGNNSSPLSKLVKSGGNFATPEAGVVGLQTGAINQQNFSYPLLATAAGTNTGYNLLGNPYPSAITVTNAALSAGPATGFFYLYTPGGSSMGPGVTSVSLASGQGFFVKATTAGNLNFTEAMKTATQPIPLLMSTSPVIQKEGFITMQMVQDSANYDVTLLRFSNDYNENYLNTEDADDLSANGQTVFLGAMTADKHLVSTASQPLNKKKTAVSLSVDDDSSGAFTLNKMNLTDIPDKYDVWLKDNYKKDSLDLRANSTYNFDIDKNNAATFGNNRFEVVVSVKTLPPYKLITFNGQRALTGNVLKWSTQNEYNYTYFQVEKSLDNKNFVGIDNSISASTGNYSFTDLSTDHLVYYRLKQTDIYDVVTYSSVIVVVQPTENATFSVFPNPVSDMLQFNIKAEVKGSIKMSIYNSVGRIVRSSQFSSKTGQENLSSLIPGPYTVELFDNGVNKVIATSKFIKL